MNALQTLLKLRINNDGGSVRAFAKKVGLSHTMLARKLSGESDFILGEIATISATLGYETPSRFMADVEARTDQIANANEGTSLDGYTIQDKASRPIILQVRHVDWDGGDASRGPLKVDGAHEAYAENPLLEAAAAQQKTVLILGSPHIRRWFDEGLLARAQGDMLQIQVQILVKLQRLNTRAFEDLHARQRHGEGRGAICDVENELVDVSIGHRGGLVDAFAAAGVEREGERDREDLLGVVGDCVDCDGSAPGVA